MKRLLLSIALLLLMIFNAFAGQGQANEEGNIFWQSGKIYVVIAVIAIIFAGIIIYLISIDRKVGKMEKELKNKQ